MTNCYKPNGNKTITNRSSSGSTTEAVCGRSGMPHLTKDVWRPHSAVDTPSVRPVWLHVPTAREQTAAETDKNVRKQPVVQLVVLHFHMIPSNGTKHAEWMQNYQEPSVQSPKLL